MYIGLTFTLIILLAALYGHRKHKAAQRQALVDFINAAPRLPVGVGAKEYVWYNAKSDVMFTTFLSASERLEGDGLYFIGEL